MSMSCHMVGVVALKDELYDILVSTIHVDSTPALEILKSSTNGYQPTPRITDVGYDDIRHTIKFESSFDCVAGPIFIQWLKENSKSFLITHTYETTFSVNDVTAFLVHNYSQTESYKDEFEYELNKYQVKRSGCHIYVPEESGYGYYREPTVNWKPL